MSNCTNDIILKNAVSRIEGQIKIDEETSSHNKGRMTITSGDGAIKQSLDHFTKLYANYVHILIQVEQCYDRTIQPHKHDAEERTKWITHQLTKN
mmetsp:Transcript_52343/g.63083  ORF Transcript_52343/g.63083 Transcript_52343/m.63083 type:complete len:95 (+) Transcript_52343:542-826(+)